MRTLSVKHAQFLSRLAWAASAVCCSASWSLDGPAWQALEQAPRFPRVTLHWNVESIAIPVSRKRENEKRKTQAKWKRKRDEMDKKIKRRERYGEQKE